MGESTRLDGKVAVVTGAASGIGLGIARSLIASGAHVVLADIDGDAAAGAAAELDTGAADAVARALDVSERHQVEDLAAWAWDRFGHVDILVSNAGVIPGIAPLIEVEEQLARWVLEVNLMGAWYGLSAFGRRFVAQGTSAHLLMTGSEHSLGMPHTGAGFYTASKHALLALSDVLRHELPDFVTVSVLCPGVVRTNLASSAVHRPARFGGPGEGRPPIEVGMNPDDVGRLAVEGMCRGDFLITTHPEVRMIAAERADEVAAAFDRAFGPPTDDQAPPQPWRFTLHEGTLG